MAANDAIAYLVVGFIMVIHGKICEVLTQKKRRPLRVLTFTCLFPNNQFPTQALFVRERILALSKYCELKVVAPVPLTFPLPRLGERYYRYSQVQSQECQGELAITHPRFFVFPKIFKVLDGFLLALSVMNHLRKLRKNFPFDVIDAHWAYPDGVAAVVLSRYFGVPLALTVRGDDINVFGRQMLRRRVLKWALRHTDLVLALSNELKEGVEALQGQPNVIEVSPNGVDPHRFHLTNQREARRQLGLSVEGKILLSIGRLHFSKGHHILVEALGRLGDAAFDIKLVIIGDTDHESDILPTIKAIISKFNLHDCVLLIGPQSPDRLRDWYNAADLFCLATSREGSANVLLEAQACGLPCITTPVGGNPDIICHAYLGMLIPIDSDAFAKAFIAALSLPWDREAISIHGLQRTWETVGKECAGYLRRVVCQR